MSDNLIPDVSIGDTVVIQLRDGKFWDADAPEYTDKYAHRILTPPESKTILHPSQCCDSPDADGTTLCPKCLDSWVIDFYVVRPEELANPSDPTLN